MDAHLLGNLFPGRSANSTGNQDSKDITPAENYMNEATKNADPVSHLSDDELRGLFRKLLDNTVPEYIRSLDSGTGRKTMSLARLTMPEFQVQNPAGDVLLNVRQAACLLGLSVWAIRKRIQRGTIKAQLIGNAYYMLRSTLLYSLVKP